jgi:hypothetical protein
MFLADGRCGLYWYDGYAQSSRTNLYQQSATARVGYTFALYLEQNAGHRHELFD